MTLVSRIKEVAQQQNMSVIDVAIKAGIAENSIYGWSQKTPKADNLAKVADVLHVSVDYLLERTDDPSTKSDDKPKYVDLTDDDIIMAFNGKPISDKYRRAIKAFLEEDDD